MEKETDPTGKDRQFEKQVRSSGTNTQLRNTSKRKNRNGESKGRGLGSGFNQSKKEIVEMKYLYRCNNVISMD